MRSSVPAHPNFNCQTLPPQDQISTRPGHRFRTNTTRMAQSFSFQQQQGGDIGIQQQKITIPNNRGEKLVGILLETGSRELVVICHGFQSSKEGKTIASVAAALTREGISTFRFDFSGNGESEGSFQYGNYREEADDLHAVVLYFSGIKREISAIIGHSKGNVEFRVTEESLMDRLNTDMRAACLSIDKDCRVLTVHGSEDEIIPVEDASEFAKLIPNHKLHILEGANHGYNSHRDELASIVLDFLRESVKQDAH
ncbi:uncharacterized protein LOC131222731 isoform X2 [Magnolia sinica]|uniref:uncharacterized protein LOC131222731 isoform X2 n=1 Tax=Magnolia sinica TaxID=86752 RepID=UPI00265A48FF|nr:uncharacterized protein LOC131222731 isoform X2 [Magnolia sinica]